MSFIICLPVGIGDISKDFNRLTKLNVYHLRTKFIFSKFHVKVPNHCLGDYIPDTREITPVWKSPFRTPSSKKDGDISWRILNNRIASPRYLHGIGAKDSNTCPFCDNDGTVFHMFWECRKLSPLKEYLSR